MRGIGADPFVLTPRRPLVRALVVPAALMCFAILGCEKRDTTTTTPTTQDPVKAGDGGTAATGPTDANPNVAASDVILLGEVGSLTGSEATFGISTQRGIQMAVDEWNAKGGVKLADGTTKKLDVRVYDDQGKPEEAANAVT